MKDGRGPLVAFTSLAIAGAGLVAADAAVGAPGGSTGFAAAGAVLMGAGIAVSLVHLGQKRRAGLAARGIGRSALSNEAAAAIVAALAAAAAALFGAAGRPNAAVSAVAGLASAAFLLSIGLVYRVGGQRTWRGFTVATPLTGGLAFGAVTLHAASAAGGIPAETLLAVAADTLVFSRRWRDIVAMRVPAAVGTDAWWRRRAQALGARFFLLDALPVFLLATGAARAAAICAAAGLVVDRVAFYALAVQHTTEFEAGLVEERLGRMETDP